jgi:Up-Regulated in long-lived daf-2
MGDRRTTGVTVVNHFDGRATVALTHRHSDEQAESRTWPDLAPGVAGEPLTVHYETGFLSGWDYWKVRVDVLDGRERGAWENDDWKECYLTEDDQGTVLTFDVSSGGGFKLNMISSSCEDGLSKVS